MNVLNKNGALFFLRDRLPILVLTKEGPVKVFPHLFVGLPELHYVVGDPPRVGCALTLAAA